MSVKLTPKITNVLRVLSRADGWMVPTALPDGNGRAGCASGETLRKMQAAGLIEYGKEPAHSLYGYRITTAGRLALQGADHV